MLKPIDRTFFERNTVTVAKEMLGQILVMDDLKSMIVETEAYVGLDDKACHASFRKKETCYPLWGPAGFAYIYLIYGIYYMLNISTEKEGFPAGVLIRAVEPLFITNKKTNGPGKLTKTFNINSEFNNVDITKVGRLFIAENMKNNKPEIVETTRIGVDYAGEDAYKPWRFYIKDNPYVSRY